jgi:hypothetical protein
MFLLKRALIICSFLIPAGVGYADRSSMSDQDVAKAIIYQSISSYPGNCPCPYNRASNGSRCGKRSAYSRGGGYNPICYERDVTQQMIRDFRRGK